MRDNGNTTKREKLIIAIDFDGTICESVMPGTGALRKNAKEVINRLYDEGHQIIIWTCREAGRNLEEAIKWLKENSIKYHKVNENSDWINHKYFPKIYANVYVDDKQVGGLPDWLDIYEIIIRDWNLGLI